MRFRSLQLVAFFLASSLAAQASPAPGPPFQAVREDLQAFMQKRQIPGLAVAVGLRGQQVWAEAFGVADLAGQTPLTDESVFPLGSTSKALTSLALGKLVEEKRLSLDAPIQEYVPYFPKKEHPLTPRLLAGHLSGLRDYDMQTEYYNTRSFSSVRESVAVFQDAPLRFEPGTQYSYSAYNFVLLSAAIEGASGKDFLTFMAERVFSPLGLRRTGPDRRPAATMPGLVTCYVAGRFGNPIPVTPLNVSNKWAAGGFVSTPSEMVQIGNALLKGRIVRPETFTLLTTPQTLKNGKDSGAGYGMGWRSGPQKLPLSGRELRAVHHGGTAHGAMSFFVLFPEVDLVVSIQANLLVKPFEDFAAEAFRIADHFLAAGQPQVRSN